MSITKVHRVVFCALLCMGVAMGFARTAPAQDTSQPSRAAAEKLRLDETNFDTELYLVLASNQRAREGQLPSSLDQVAKQLRATLQFKHYSLAGTFINRVKNNGSLSLRWVGEPLGAPSPAIPNNPSFIDFSINLLRLVESDGGQLVQLMRFNFGSRIPIQTGTNLAASGTNSAPVISYEHTGINTDISVRPDEPAVVGTLNVGSSGDAIIVVICAKRVKK